MGLNGNGSAKIAAPDGRLRSWKEIASYFGADERTVKRWEVTRGLPVHRVPGEARAPVYAFEAELAAWLRAAPATAVLDVANASDPPGAANMPAHDTASARPLAVFERVVPWRVGGIAAVLLVALLFFAVQGWRRAESERRTTIDRVADVRQLARSQVAALNDQLERQPGTVRTRARLALEAAAMLARVAVLPDAPPALARDAAEAYRRLAIVEAAADRPSLRDRTAARAALAAALRLVSADQSQPGRWLRARIFADAARQAAADGAVATAPAMLVAAAALATDAPPALRDELRLANGEVGAWQGNYALAARLAAAVAAAPIPDAAAALRHVRALDQEGEAHFYAGQKAEALAAYRAAVASAAQAVTRWPAEQRFRWALQRQQWSLGTTLVDAGAAGEALAVLGPARRGWMAMAAADPEDESLAAWVRIIRIAYGQAMTAAGHPAEAITELNASVADRRRWLAAAPMSAERRRALVVGLSALAEALGSARRHSEACMLFDEALDTTRRMASTGGLTRLDRDSEVRLLDEGRARYCAAGLTRPAKPV